MVQMAQYVCFKSDLYDHCDDICRYGTLDQLRDMGVYAIRESLADEILNDLSYDEDYAPTDDAKDTIISAIYATFEEKYGEDFADCADNFIQDNDDIAGRVNPCAMSVETVRAVNEKGYDAVFAEQWKAELSECDIDPEAVSVDSEAHDMENGRDGLDGNAPEKDAPEKDDRDAQPPVDTDNRKKCAWKRVRARLHPFSAERRLYGTETERAYRLRRRPLLRRRRRRDGDKRPHGT